MPLCCQSSCAVWGGTGAAALLRNHASRPAALFSFLRACAVDTFDSEFLTPLSLCMCSVIVVALGGGVWCCVEGGRSKWAVATRAPKYTVQLRPVIGQEVLAALCMCVCMCVCSTCQVASHGRVHADKDGHAGGGMGTTLGSWA
jgi:hypothetical protein